jgi:hypothetical protein
VCEFEFFKEHSGVKQQNQKVMRSVFWLGLMGSAGRMARPRRRKGLEIWENEVA